LGIGKENLPRLAASSYLNTAPLIWSFTRGSRQSDVDLVTDTSPAECADMLAHGKVDAALVPVIDYQTIPEITLLGKVCVGSRSQVRSVVLVTAGLDLKEVRKVSLDKESRTSATLVRLIFREFLGIEPEWTTSAPDLGLMLKNADAALLIGDPAMSFNRAGLRVYDLASLWREKTGLGFVFAMWMGRERAIGKIAEVDFAAARDEGLLHVDEIAEAYERELHKPKADLCEYLRENITFNLDPEMQAGLELFYALAFKHGLIQNLRALEFGKYLE
jgi:chorismate dehydratase